MGTHKPLIIYHYPCADGFTSAYCAWRKFGDTADYVPGSYSIRGELPDVEGRVVYVLDFSYSQDTMRKMAADAEQIIVLDHHRSAEKELRPLLDEGIIGGEFDMERSGAGMAWDYFHPGQLRPQFVDYVQDRDLWKFQMTDSKEVNQAIFSYEYTFENWHHICQNVSLLQTEGKTILRNHMKNVKEMLQEGTTTITIQGYTVPAVNVNYVFGSDAAGILCDGQPFAVYFWMNKEGRMVFGLRSKEGQPQAVDVSEIAKRYPGGGGHKHASGFTVDSIDKL